MHEDWRDIPGYEGVYQASNLGRIRSLNRPNHAGKILVATDNGTGYLQVGLSLNKVHKKFTVHRLVLLAFAGPLPEGHNRNHRNGNKHDNRPKNLEYVLFHENSRHAVQSLHRQFGSRGEKSGSARLTDEQVKEIRALYDSGRFTYRQLAPMFGVGKSTIGAITARRSWTHIA
jgi:hypothetical protein